MKPNDPRKKRQAHSIKQPGLEGVKGVTPNDDPEASSFLERPCQRHVQSAVLNRMHFSLFGPAGQGKTQILNHIFGPGEAIHIECRAGFKRPEVYRILLSNVGYSFSVGKRERTIISHNSKSSASFSSTDPGNELSSRHGLSSTFVDLANPTEVAHMVARLTNVPYVLLNNFELLDEGTKVNILRDVGLFYDSSTVRFGIIGNWIDQHYLDGYWVGASRKVKCIFVDYWSMEELSKLVRRKLEALLGRPPEIRVVNALAQAARGDVSTLNEIFAHLTSESSSELALAIERPEAIANLLKRVDAEMFSRVRHSFLELVSIWVGSDKGVCFYHRPDIFLEHVSKRVIKMVPSPKEKLPVRSSRAVRADSEQAQASRKTEKVAMVRRVTVKQVEVAVVKVSHGEFSLPRQILLFMREQINNGAHFGTMAELSTFLESGAFGGLSKCGAKDLIRNVKRVIDIQRRKELHPMMVDYSVEREVLYLPDSLFASFLRIIDLDLLNDELEAVDGSDDSFSIKYQRVVTEFIGRTELYAHSNTIKDAIAQDRVPVWPWLELEEWQRIKTDALPVFCDGQPIEV